MIVDAMPVGAVVSVSIGMGVDIVPVGAVVSVAAVGAFVEVGPIGVFVIEGTGEFVIEGTGEFVIVGVGEFVGVGTNVFVAVGAGGFVEVGAFVAVGAGAELQVGPEMVLPSVVKELVSEMSRPLTEAPETRVISREAISVPFNPVPEAMIASRPICQNTLQGCALPAMTTVPENVISRPTWKTHTSL
jgi:hypothetical protein